MYFESIEAAIHMDGHGGFVWSAYAITFLFLVLVVVLPIRRRRRILRELEGQLRREAHLSAEEGST